MHCGCSECVFRMLVRHTFDLKSPVDSNKIERPSGIWLLYLGRLFVQEASNITTRGVLRGYKRVKATLHTVRGRISFARQIGRPGLPVECSFNKFTNDIVENRILCTAAHRLGAMLRMHWSTDDEM